MTETAGLPVHKKVLSRTEAIGRLRVALKRLTDDEHSLCAVAAKKGIFCHGFARFDEKELRDRFHNLVEKRPGLNRWQMESLANEWQLARQIVNNVSTACDAQTQEHDTCRGWDEFSNEDLAQHCADVLGIDVLVTESGQLEAPGPPV